MMALVGTRPDASVHGRAITILRFQRRFAGTHDMVQKD